MYIYVYLIGHLFLICLFLIITDILSYNILSDNASLNALISFMG